MDDPRSLAWIPVFIVGCIVLCFCMHRPVRAFKGILVAVLSALIYACVSELRKIR